MLDNGSTFNYYYDGEGRRVKKEINGVETTYVYNAFGELSAEYSEAANPASGTQYLTADHLGSTRLVTSETGGIVHETNYYPFGEEIAGGDWFNPKFTGKLRDYESGLNLDYFGAIESRINELQHGQKKRPAWCRKEKGNWTVSATRRRPFRKASLASLI